MGAGSELNAMGKVLQTEPAVNRVATENAVCHRAYIHYNPQRIDYAVTAEELERLIESGQNSWKEFCLVYSSVGVPCLINAVAAINGQVNFTLTMGVFLNCLVGGLGISLAICFAILWGKTSKAV